MSHRDRPEWIKFLPIEERDRIANMEPRWSPISLIICAAVIALYVLVSLW